MKCLVLSDDLMFGSQVIQAARQAKCDVVHVNSVAAWTEYLEANPETIYFVVDLNTSRLRPADLAGAAEGIINPTGLVRHWLAIGPHVHRGKLDAARDLGWDVLTRGQFHAEGSKILQAWSTAQSSTLLADGETLANPLGQ